MNILSTTMRFLTQKKYAVFFNENEKVTQFVISWKLKYNCRRIKTKWYVDFANIVKMVQKWRERQKIVWWQFLLHSVQDQILISTHSLWFVTYITLTISCTLRVLIIFSVTKSSFRQEHVNIKPNLLYFSVLGVCLNRWLKHNVWPVKTALTLCTSSSRFQEM